MRRDFLEQRMGPAQTTGRRCPIFCSISRMVLPTGAIEAIFEFRSRDRDMEPLGGPPQGPPRGKKNPISRPMGQNSKIPSIAPVGISIRVIMQKIQSLRPVVWAGPILGSKKSLRILYYEDSCNVFQ